MNTANQNGMPHLRWVEGERAILSLMPLLQQRSAEWGQQAEVLQIPYALSMPSIPRRQPVLLLAESDDGTAKKILGAVLVFAQLHALFGKRLITNSDRFGNLGVFGPAGHRLSLAMLAADMLIERGAALVRLDFAVGQPPAEDVTTATPQQARERFGHLPNVATRSNLTLRLHTRTKASDLLLAPDLDATLAALGRRTRRNIRASRRKINFDLHCTFHRHASISLAEFLRFSASCRPRTPSRVARWQYANATSSPGFLSGLQTDAGVWICLSGGRLLEQTAVIDWQMNSPSFPAYSPSLTMRGYLMEEFGRSGFTRLRFEGGTSHTMAEGFEKRTVCHLEVRVQSTWLRVFERCIKSWLPGRAITRSLFSGSTASRAAPSLRALAS